MHTALHNHESDTKGARKRPDIQSMLTVPCVDPLAARARAAAAAEAPAGAAARAQAAARVGHDGCRCVIERYKRTCAVTCKGYKIEDVGPEQDAHEELAEDAGQLQRAKEPSRHPRREEEEDDAGEEREVDARHGGEVLLGARVGGRTEAREEPLRRDPARRSEQQRRDEGDRPPDGAAIGRSQRNGKVLRDFEKFAYGMVPATTPGAQAS